MFKTFLHLRCVSIPVILLLSMIGYFECLLKMKVALKSPPSPLVSSKERAVPLTLEITGLNHLIRHSYLCPL